jgi:pseudo-rSAM protein
MKKFWLILFPDTFLWRKNGHGIIYNSKTFKHFTFQCSDEIDKLCDALTDLDSLYSVEVTNSLICNKSIAWWIDKITRIQAGSLIEQNGQNSKITSYYPFLRIQRNLDKLILDHNQNMGGMIMENLHELAFYINGSVHGSDQYYKQTYFPLKTDVSLDFNHIVTFVEQCTNRMSRQITIIGDLVNYKNLQQLQNWVLSNDFLIHFVLLAEDLEEELAKFDWFNSDKISITIIVRNHSTFLNHFKLYQYLAEDVTFVFPVESMHELDSVSSIVKEVSLINYNIIPLYNGTNKFFFEKNVYMTKDEFDEIKLSRREIFVNMTLNIFFFGKLTILPDGKIYSNVNDAPLGLLTDHVYDMIYAEMTERKMWLRIRDMEPCCNCIYQWLCPSPGNYELAIGSANLCHVTV